MSGCPHGDGTPQSEPPFAEALDEVRDAVSDKWQDVAEGLPDGQLRDFVDSFKETTQKVNKFDDIASVADSVIDEVYGPTSVTPSTTPSTNGVPNEAWVNAGLKHWVDTTPNTSSNA